MGGRELHAFAPGRTEIAGNHTDHEGGHVIAAAIDRGISAVVVPEYDAGIVRIESEGFAPVVVDLSEADALSPRARERGTSAALVRGVLAGLRDAGVAIGGFRAQLATTLPAGGGLSSSAAFELLIGVIANELFAGGRVGQTDLAHIAQRAETQFFGKPCGLMDQMAIACGGVSVFDFADRGGARAGRIDCDMAIMGLAVVLVDVGCDHSRFTQEYALVPAQMQAVAALVDGIGRTDGPAAPTAPTAPTATAQGSPVGRADVAPRLVDVSEQAVRAQSARIRRELGDRALLRALHFYREERLTVARTDALRAGDAARFLELTRASGASSAMFLQNVSAPGDYQPAMVALALAQGLLDVRGAVRIHGGGFGGSIQAFVPLEQADAFVGEMDALLGEGSCLRVQVGGPGAGVR